MTLTVLYFAWLRDGVGQSRETVSPPKDVTTVAGLMDWLSDQSPGHAQALKDRSMIRAAVDQEHVPLDAPISGAKEVALFPPVTGG